jgi:predicted GIY-YIG superfamily endonuclease
MTTADERGWKLHQNEQRMAWLRLTPAQRLAWLEEAKRFAEAAKRARKIAADDRQSQSKRA